VLDPSATSNSYNPVPDLSKMLDRNE